MEEKNKPENALNCSTETLISFPEMTISLDSHLQNKIVKELIECSGDTEVDSITEYLVSIGYNVNHHYSCGYHDEGSENRIISMTVPIEIGEVKYLNVGFYGNLTVEYVLKDGKIIHCKAYAHVFCFYNLQGAVWTREELYADWCNGGYQYASFLDAPVSYAEFCVANGISYTDKEGHPHIVIS